MRSEKSAIFAVFYITAPVFAAPPASTTASQPDAKAEGNRLKASAHDLHALAFDQIRYSKITGWLSLSSGDSLNASGPVDVISLKTKNPSSWKILQVTSQVIRPEFRFNDVVPSWNIDVPTGGGFVAQLRVGRHENDFWTPFYFLGTYGQVPQEEIPAKTLQTSDAEINLDYLQSRHSFDRMQYRFILASPTDQTHRIPRVALAYSNTLDDYPLWFAYHREIQPGPKDKWARRLPVPFRSQKWEDDQIRGRICSPTSVSMVLEYRGVKLPTVEVCQTIWDPEYKLYGNWWRAVQGAFVLGVPGYIERFGDWNAVKKHIVRGEPVIASIKVKKGQMRSAPYRQTDGHLLVITGFTETGDICINDPAAATPEQGIAVYPREDMERVWLANGGVGYVLESTSKPDREMERGGDGEK